MTILIPSSGMKTGGASTFVNKFSAASQRLGHTVIQSFRGHFDHLLVVGDVPIGQYHQILFAKLIQRPIVQRLDGVYTPTSVAGPWYWAWNLKAKIIHNFLADKIIYQSRFSKLSCEKFLGATRAQSTIIYNGVDLKKFTPGNRQKPSKRVRLVTAGMFRRKDQIEPIIRAVQKLDPNYELAIYGALSDTLAPLIHETKNDRRFLWEGKKSNDELARQFPLYDIFLFSDQSACPNVVLEAMAAGLPVVAFDRGSIRELVQEGVSGAVVPLSEHDQFANLYPFLEGDYRIFATEIERVADNLKKLQLGARRVAERKFGLDAMVESYIKFIKSGTSKKNSA